MNRLTSTRKFKRSFAIVLALVMISMLLPIAAGAADTLETPVLIQKGAPTDTPGSAGNPASHTQYRSLIFKAIDGATGYNVYAYATKADAEADENRVAEALNVEETLQSGSTGGTMSQSPMKLEEGEMLIDVRLIQFTDVKEGATRTLPANYTPAGLGDTYYPGPAGSGDQTNLKPGQYWFRVQAVRVQASDAEDEAVYSELSEIYADGDAFSIAAGPNEAKDLIEAELKEKGLPGSEPGAAWYLVDLRGQYEFSDEGIIRFSDSTRKTPGDFNTTEKAEAIFGTDKTVRIFVFCRGGGRAVTAARHLSNAGYTNVINIQGVNQWTNGLRYDDPTFRFTAVPTADIAALVDGVTKEASDKDGAIGPAPTPGQPHEEEGITYDAAANALRWYNIPRAKFNVYAFSSYSETNPDNAVASGALPALDLLVDGSGADWRLARKFDLADLKLDAGTYFIRVQAAPEVELPVEGYSEETIWGAPSVLSDAIEVSIGDAAPAEQPSAQQTAIASPQKVYIDGAVVEFEAYNIDGYNYFKLRDVAMAINGSEKQFGVGYDAETNTATITSGDEYVPVGGELEPGDGVNKTVSATSQTILNDGEALSFVVYNIGGYNFLKLRDLGEAIGFSVDYDAEINAVVVSTGAADEEPAEEVVEEPSEESAEEPAEESEEESAE